MSRVDRSGAECLASHFRWMRCASSLERMEQSMIINDKMAPVIEPIKQEESACCQTTSQVIVMDDQTLFD